MHQRTIFERKVNKAKNITLKMEIVKFDEWSKIDFRVGEVKDISKNYVKIIINHKTFNTQLNLNVQKGDKIAVIINQDNLIIPLIGNSIIIPEKDIEIGSKIR